MDSHSVLQHDRDDRCLTDRCLTDRCLTDRRLTDRRLTDHCLTDHCLTDRRLADRRLADRRLIARASRRYVWHWLDTQVAGQAWQIATPSDPDRMLLDACRRQDAGEVGVIDPFWATTWRAADGLDQFLQMRELHNVRVLELGCGTGRAGLAAAIRGSQVTLTDGVSDPLLLVQLTTMPMRDRCTIRRLRFGEDRLRQPPFPIVLGSDITYLRDIWPKLDVCLRHHLAAGGEAILSDPYRSISNEFAGWIVKRKWRYEEHRITMVDEPNRPIRIMCLSR